VRSPEASFRSGVRVKPSKTSLFFSGLVAVALVFALRGAAGAEGLPAGSSVELDIVVGNSRGRVLCGVYERSGWLRRPVRGAVASIRGGIATCRFSELRPGVYAAGAFQDENLNGRLDRRWTGLPSEPWCVTRESRGTIGAPSFESASFAVGASPVHLRCRAR
jgi:uncharacterized protein (DUF2141 family)